MGCTSSKRIEGAVVVDPYSPISPASFSIFDVYAIQEPWLNAPGTVNEIKKPSHVPAPILEKLNAIEEAPRTWDEVSKVLEDLKPKLNATLPPQPPPQQQQKIQETPPSVPRAGRPPRRKSFSFHTLEELEARANSSRPPARQTAKTDHEPKFEVEKFRTRRADSRNGVITSDVPRSLNDNMFIVRDKFQRERERKSSGFVKSDPLSE